MLKPIDSGAADRADREGVDSDTADATVARFPSLREPEPTPTTPPEVAPPDPRTERDRDVARQKRLGRFREERRRGEPRERKRQQERERSAPEPAKPPRRRSTLSTLVRAVVQIGLMAAVLFGAYLGMQRLIDARPEREPRPRPERVSTIETVPAVLAANRPTLTLYGEVVAGRSIDLRAPTSGEIVEVSPDLRAGLRVEREQRLLAIDDFDARAALAEARADLATTRGQIAETEARIAAEEAQIAASEEQAQLAREDFERTESLVRRGTLPAAQLDQKRLALSQAEQGALTRRANLDLYAAQLSTQRAGVERLELRVEQAERALANTVLVAPFGGVVNGASAEVGRDVTPADVLVSLYDDERLEARFLLTDAQYGRVATDADPLIGRPVSVTWTVGGTPYEFAGEVDRIGAEIATDRGGVEVFARIDASGADVRLRPGAFVEIVLPDRTFADTFRLPETALYDERDVYVNAGGTLERRAVERLAYDGEDVIVRAAAENGLAAGERVMITRISRVDAGLSVREPGEAPDSPAGAAGGGREEVIAAAAEANGMSAEELRALPAAERRRIVREYRASEGLERPGGDPDRAARRAQRGGGGV